MYLQTHNCFARKWHVSMRIRALLGAMQDHVQMNTYVYALLPVSHVFGPRSGSPRIIYIYMWKALKAGGMVKWGAVAPGVVELKSRV